MKTQTREIQLLADGVDGDLVPCVLATEVPVERGDFIEVLSHGDGDVDLTRAPLPLIVQHDRGQLNVGIVEQIQVAGRKLRGVARFSSGELAQQILADVKAGIVRSLSIGYQLGRVLSKNGRVMRFAYSPFEVSVVSVPADPGAGFYR